MPRHSLPLFLLAASLYAQHDASKDTKRNPAFGNPQAVAAGHKLFLNSCAGCHGPAGEGGRGPNLRNRGVWHPLEDDALYTMIRKGLPGTDMPPTSLSEEQAWNVAAFVRSLSAPAIENPPPGNPASGESLFFAKAACSNCHRILGRGGMLGPDLSNIGATQPAQYIRESILNPSADGFPHHKPVTITLSSGATLKGVARNYTNYSLQLQDAQGNLHLVDMATVKSIAWSPNSAMPANYKDRLSKQELDDIIAFLSRRSVRPYTPAESK